MIEELLGILLEGAQSGGAQQPQQRAQPRSPFEDLLEGVLGGTTSAGGEQQAPQAAPGSIGDLLEDILNGGAAPAQSPSQAPEAAIGGGLGDLIEIFMGGGGKDRNRGSSQGAVGSNPLLAPFTEALSERLGISPQMASVIVSAAFALIVGKMGSSRKTASHDSGRSGAGGLDLDDLLDGDFLKSEGVAEKVARQTGMDQEEAARSLREAMEMMGLGGAAQSTPRSASKAKPKKPSKKRAPKKAPKAAKPKSGSLENLLDTWEVD